MRLVKRKITLFLLLCICIGLILPLASCRGGAEHDTSDISLEVSPTDTPTSQPTEASPDDTPNDIPDTPSEDIAEQQTQESTGDDNSETNTQAPTEATPTQAPTENVTEAPTEAETLPVIDTIPRIDITTVGGAGINSKDDYTPSSISVSNCPELYAFEGVTAGVRLRGNSTAVAPKRPYRIKFDKKHSMLGLNGNNKYKSWVLLADYYDSSMLRTYSTFNMAELLLDGKYYSSDCLPVEVYVNGEYNGIYLLCEQTQMNEGRVNIPEKTDFETSVNIGYLLVGQGGRTDEPNSVVINMDMTVTDRNGSSMYLGGGNFSLSGGDYTQEQMTYVQNYLGAVYEVIDKALHENIYYTLDRECNLTLKTDFVGTTNEEKQIETVDAVFNIDAAVRLCILDEIIKNLDSGTYNMYVDLSPTGDGRLTLGAPWDFDFALGNTRYNTTHSTSGFYATNFTYSEGMRVNTVYVLFGKVPWFEAMVREVWQENYSALCAFSGSLLTHTEKFGEYYERDFAYWQRSPMGHHCMDCRSEFKTHADTAVFLNNWLNERLEWLNKHWGVGWEDYEEELEKTEPLKIDFSTQEGMSYVYGLNDCKYAVGEGFTAFQTLTAYDPYFYIDMKAFGKTAEDYGVLEIEYLMPDTNINTSYPIEVFLCAGNIMGAVGGISVTSDLGAGDRQWHTLRIDLTVCPEWTGYINAIRMDFFSISKPYDTIYIKSVSLTN